MIRTILALLLFASLTCSAAPATNVFIRGEAFVKLDDWGNYLSVTNYGPKHCTFDYHYKGGHGVLEERFQGDWFLFIESPNVLWIYDGFARSLNRMNLDGVPVDPNNRRKRLPDECPPPLRQALPKTVYAKFFGPHKVSY